MIYLVHFNRVVGREKLYPKLDVHIFCRPVFTKAGIKPSGLQQVEDELFPWDIHIQEACHTAVAVLVTLERFEPGERHVARSNARSNRRHTCLKTVGTWRLAYMSPVSVIFFYMGGFGGGEEEVAIE